MRKYFKIWFLMLLIIPTICMITACGGNKAKPEAIKISDLTTFAWGEEFDYSDVEIVLEMSDGEDKTISFSEINVDSSSYKQYEAGTYPIIFSYKKDDSISMTVNVTVSERTFASPAASISGAKTEYLIDEDLDLSVGTITVFYNEEDQQGKKAVQVALNDSKVTIDQSNFDNSAIASNQEIKATYLGKTASFFVNVVGEIENVSSEDWTGEYDGSAHSILVESEGTTITYATTENGTYSATNPGFTNVGEYDVYYKVSLEGYKTVTGVQTVTIEKATNSFTTVPGIANWNYGNPPFVPSGVAAFGDVVFEYKLASALDSTYTTTVPTAIGDYVFRASVAGTTNYTGLSIKFGFAINSLGELAGNVTNYSGEYDGEEHSATITCETAGSTITYATTENGTYSATNPSYTNVCDNTIYYKIVKDGYTSASGSARITITKATNSFTTSPSITDWNFGETASVPAGVTAFGDVVFEYKLASALDSTYTTTVPTAIGDYVLRASAADTINYTGLFTTVEFSINSLGELVGNVTNYSGEYDGEEHSATITCETAGSTITYATTENGTYSATNPSYTEIGNYTIYYKIEKLGYTSASGSATISISKKINAFTTEPSIVSWAYGQTANAPQGVAKYGVIVFEYKLASALDSTYTTTVPTEFGSYILRATVEETATYTGLSKTVPFEVIGDLDLDFTENNYSGEYDGELHTATVSSSIEGVSIVYSLEEDGDYSTDIHSYKNVGTYLVYYQISKVGYKQESGSVSINITKANNEFTVNPTVEDWTYGQIPNTPAATAKFGTVIFEYKLKNALDSTYSTSVPYQLGDYQVRAKVAETDNYSSAVSDTVGEFTITPIGEITFVVNNCGGDYDGYAYSIEVEYTPLDAVITYSTTENGFYAPNSIEYTDSGSYTVYFKIQLAGYITKTGFGTVLINKCTIDEPTVYGEYIYDGNPKECNFDFDSDFISMSNESVTRATEAGTYELTFTLIDPDNSEWATGSDGVVSWEIEKADNEWTQELSIANWEVSSEDSNPTAKAKYGEVVFSYRAKTDTEYTNVKPGSVGEYYVKASVEGTSNYNALSDEIAFEIEKITPIISNPGILEALYHDAITDVIIPNGGLEGYWTWVDDGILLTELGCKVYMANFTPYETNLYKTITDYPIYINVTTDGLNDFSSSDIIVNCEDGNYTGNEYAPYVTVIGEGADDATIVYCYGSNDMVSSVSITDAGTYTIVYIISNTNFNSYCGEMVLEIAQVESQIPENINFDCTEETYFVGQLLKNISLGYNYSGDATEGTFSWEDEEATILSGINSYNILFTPDSDNYLPRTISVDLTGEDVVPEYVEVLSRPERQYFYSDEELDFSGLELKVYFNNGDVEYIDNLEDIDYEYDAALVGERQYIYFSYDGCETTNEFEIAIIEHQNHATIYFESEDGEEPYPLEFEDGVANLNVGENKVSVIELSDVEYSLDCSSNREVLAFGTNKTCVLECDLQWRGDVVDTYIINLTYTNPDIDFRIGNKKAVLEDGKYVLDGVIASKVTDLDFNSYFYDWEGIYANGKLYGYSDDYMLSLGTNEIKLCYSTAYGFFDFELVINTKELPLKTITVGNKLNIVDELNYYLLIGATYSSYIEVYYDIVEGYEVVLQNKGDRKYFESGDSIQYTNAVDSQSFFFLIYEEGGYAAYLEALNEGNEDDLFIQTVDILVIDNPGVKELTIITDSEEVELFEFIGEYAQIHGEIEDIEVELFQSFEGEFSYDLYLNEVLYDSENPLNRVYYYGYNSINVVVYLDGEEYNYLSYAFFYEYFSDSLSFNFDMSPFIQENDSYDVYGIEKGTKIYMGSTLLFEATEDGSNYCIESIPKGENTYTFVFTKENYVVKGDLIVFNTMSSNYKSFNNELNGYSLSINEENFYVNYRYNIYLPSHTDIHNLDIELLDFTDTAVPNTKLAISTEKIRKNVYLLRMDYTYEMDCYVYYLYIYLTPMVENGNTNTDFYYMDIEENTTSIVFEDGEANLEINGGEEFIYNPENPKAIMNYFGDGILADEYNKDRLYFTNEEGTYSVTITIISTDGSASATYTINFTIKAQKVYSIIVDEENHDKDLELFTNDGENFSGDFAFTMSKSGSAVFSAADDYSDYTFYDENGNAWESGQKYVLISNEDIITSGEICLLLNSSSTPISKYNALIPVNEDAVLNYRFCYQTEVIGLVEVIVYLLTPEDDVENYSIALSDTSGTELEYDFRIVNGAVNLDYQFEKGTVESVYFTPDKVYQVMTLLGYDNPLVFSNEDEDVIGYLKDGKIYYCFIAFDDIPGAYLIDDKNNVQLIGESGLIFVGTLDSETKAFTPIPSFEDIPSGTTYSYCTFAGNALDYENGASINVNDIGNCSYADGDSIDELNCTLSISCPSNVTVYIVTNTDYETVPYNAETFAFDYITDDDERRLFIVKFVIDEGLETETSFMFGIDFGYMPS